MQPLLNFSTAELHEAYERLIALSASIRGTLLEAPFSYKGSAMHNSPFSFGPISQAVFRLAAFAWFCTEVGMFIKARTPIGKDGLFWPFWIAVCAIVLLGSLLADNLRRTP